MRMDPDNPLTAAAWLARADSKEIADVLWRFGEERYSRRIARVICEARREAPDRYYAPPGGHRRSGCA